jgi:hypothetical protein
MEKSNYLYLVECGVHILLACAAARAAALTRALELDSPAAALPEHLSVHTGNKSTTVAIFPSLLQCYQHKKYMFMKFMCRVSYLQERAVIF